MPEKGKPIVSPNEMDAYIFAERLRGIAWLRQHNWTLLKQPGAPGPQLLIAEIDELGIALEDFCRNYLHVDSTQGMQLNRLLKFVSMTLDLGGANPDEIQQIRSNLLHASYVKAAAAERLLSTGEYVSNHLGQDGGKLNSLLHHLLNQVENPFSGDFRKKAR